MPIDYKKYPPNWKTEIVPAVLNRAGNCCEFCGLPNGTWIKSVEVLIYDRAIRDYALRRIWLSKGDFIRLARYYPNSTIKDVRVILTVAHLDHNPESDNFDRLRALCQYCHLLYDSREKRRNKDNQLMMDFGFGDG